MLMQILISMNKIASIVAGILMAPVIWLPGWLSSTLIAIVTGIVMLIVFKYTSNQKALKQARNTIKADLLALSLFKDDLRVILSAQLGLLSGAGRLLILSLVPTLVMVVPMVLVLGQLALRYQARPLQKDEAGIVTVYLASSDEASMSNVQLVPTSAAKLVAGPVRVPDKKMICWKIQPQEQGQHMLAFETGRERFTKELAVGTGHVPVSLKRPSWNWTDVLLHPAEPPFPAASVVQSIEIAYPERESWTAGTHSWLVYWFVMSMVAAFVARPLLNVSL